MAPWGSLEQPRCPQRETAGNLLVASGLGWCKMVGVIELESMTSTMSTWRSNQLSYTPDKLAPAAGFEPATKWLTATYSTD